MEDLREDLGEALSDSDTHITPSNMEAEEALLGALLVSPDAFRAVTTRHMTERDFYRPSHRVVFRALMDMFERGEEPDDLTLVNELKHRKQLDAAGGAAVVMSLSCPAPSNAGAYADEVIDQAHRRCILDLGNEVARLAYENTHQEVGTLASQMHLQVERAMAYLRRSNQKGRSAEELAEWATQHLMSGGGDRQWFEFPVPALQEATRGYASGQLIVVGAESSVGKSAFGQGFILSAPADTSIGYFNLEMTAEEVELRLISTMAGISIERLLQPRLDGSFDLDEAEQDAYMQAANELSERNFTVYDVKTLHEIEAIQRTEKHDLILTDHMHRLPGNEEYSGLVKITRACKNLALNTGCAHVALAQFNRGGEFGGEGPPSLRRLKGGNAIEEEADIALLLHREKNEHGYRLPDGQVIVAKNRNGQSGYAVPAVFNGRRMRWEDKRVS